MPTHRWPLHLDLLSLRRKSTVSTGESSFESAFHIGKLALRNIMSRLMPSRLSYSPNVWASRILLKLTLRQVKSAYLFLHKNLPLIYQSSASFRYPFDFSMCTYSIYSCESTSPTDTVQPLMMNPAKAWAGYTWKAPIVR